MQTVWSRIAQARVCCRCPTCSATTHGIARRATTATGRRPTKFLTSSTLLYSGIFAAAATTDAVFKQKRRQQWDRAIDGVKQDLEKDPVVQDVPETQTSDKFVDIQENLDEVETILEYARPRKDGPVWPANTGAELNRRNLPPQSMYATENARVVANDRQWSVKKTTTMELSVDELVLRIMLHLDGIEAREAALISIPEPLRSAFGRPHNELEALLHDTHRKLAGAKSVKEAENAELFTEYRGRFARYDRDSSGTSLAAHKLAASIDSLFASNQSKPSTLAQLCYELASSSAPPHLKSFNALLLGLSQNKDYSPILNMTIVTMRSAHIRMNENSLAAILYHYTINNDYKGFCRFVQRMRGEKGGLALARPDIEHLEASQGRCIRVETPTRVKIVQKPAPVPSVFEALIRGVLHFTGFESALRTCKAMGGEGWGLSIRGLTPLLLECIDRDDWEAGHAVWQQIKQVQARSRRQEAPEKIGLTTYASMLKLCGVCDKKAYYDEIFNEALASGHSQRLLLKRIADPDQAHQRYWRRSLRENEGLIPVAQFVRTSERPPLKAPQPAVVVSTITEEVDLSNDDAAHLQPVDSTTSGVENTAAQSNLTVPSIPSQDLEVRRSSAPQVRSNSPQPKVSLAIRTTRSTGLMSRDQLMGDMPPSLDLGDYEIRERPMNISL